MDTKNISKHFSESTDRGEKSYSEEDLNNAMVLSAKEDLLSISDNEIFYDTLESQESFLTNDTSFLLLPERRIDNNTNVERFNYSLGRARVSDSTSMTNLKAAEERSRQDREVNKDVPLKEILRKLIDKYLGTHAESTSESKADTVEERRTQYEESNKDCQCTNMVNKDFADTIDTTVESKTDTFTDNSCNTSYSSNGSSCTKSKFNLNINNNGPFLRRVVIHNEISAISYLPDLSTVYETSCEHASNSRISYSLPSENGSCHESENSNDISMNSDDEEISYSESASTNSFQSATNIDFTDFSVDIEQDHQTFGSPCSSFPPLDIEEDRQTFDSSCSSFPPLDIENEHQQPLNTSRHRHREKVFTPKESRKYKRRSRSLPRERSPELNFVKTNDYHSDVDDSSTSLIPQQRIRRNSSCIIQSPIKPVKQLRDYYSELEKNSKWNLRIQETIIRRRCPHVPFIILTTATP